MPHATEDEAMAGIDEAAEIQRFLGGEVAAGSLDEHAFDQADKADDAVDYEDISDDDDLPEEEEAINLDEGDENLEGFFSSAPAGMGDLLAKSPTNGFHENKPSSGELFDDADEVNDLFGDRISSPEDERHTKSQPPQQQRPGGLVLPSKSGGLALPGPGSFQQRYAPPTQESPSFVSPPPFQDREFSVMSPSSLTTDDDDDTLEPDVALQRRLFKDSRRRNAGEDVLSAPVDTDMNLFHTLYPRYEQNQAPRFVELFPPRPQEFKGKVPLKPPKPVQPTKLSLDLLQDQERSFKALAASNKIPQDSSFWNSFVRFANRAADEEDSDNDLAMSTIDEEERIGGVTMQDLALICEDWDVPSIDTASVLGNDPDDAPEHDLQNGDWDVEEQVRPAKKRKISSIRSQLRTPMQNHSVSFQDPERAVAKLAKAVALDLNDPHLLIDENAPRVKTKTKRTPGDVKRDNALNRDLAKRYNISNDQAYDLLKENHQHKIRSTLGSMAVEHSFPAVKLQYPFYKVGLDSKAKRAHHRQPLDLKNGPGREYRFQKPKHIKRKNWRGKEAKDLYARSEDLSLGDNASSILFEYSEEAPMVLSNFGMGNRLINYYRKRDADDQERPKRDIGETQVLLTQDKSPFANFGHVDRGEMVPTLQNGLFRAPVFQHEPKSNDFIVGISSTYEYGDRLNIRNVDHLYTVGQQFPLSEVPGQHSRKVTDAAKKRLRALSYRIYSKSLERKDKVLDNRTLMPHLPGHDMPQTRSKMREFMDYERVANRGETGGVWVPKAGQPIPDAETLRGWIKPEDICMLDSMQVGVQHLADLGISENKDGDEEKDIDESSNIEQQLAPWRATKNFINACQGKAMLKLHGDGDPTGRGEGFSFVKTSMKGGFRAVGESVEDKIDARRRKENGGHSYNVAKQQKAYDESIRRIWDAQKASLANDLEMSDAETEDEPEPESARPYGRSGTPRSSFGTPAAFSRHEDESVSQFSGHSAGRNERTMVISRRGGIDKYGQPRADHVETITNPRVISLYRKRRMERQVEQIRFEIFPGTKTRQIEFPANAFDSLLDLQPTGDPELDALKRQQLEKELARVTRNVDRRVAREKARGKSYAGSPSAVASPGGGGGGASEIGAPASSVAAALNGGGSVDTTPQKGRGRNKDGTARKCANCGQVGHIKTNRKSVISSNTSFTCSFCQTRNNHPNGSGGGSSGNTKRGGSDPNHGSAAGSFVSDSYSAFVL